MNKKISRRQFLYMGSVATASVALRDLLGLANLSAQDDGLGLQAYLYERKQIAALSELVNDTPVIFQYPYDHFTTFSQLIKLGTPAGGGVGPDNDIVAFHATCTHQGGPLMGSYKAEHKAMGPCPLHLTTFDMTKHGMVISGHASQGLPQVILDVDGDDIYAIGIMGLIYGYQDNAVDPNSIGG